MTENELLAQNGEIILYQPDSSIRLEVLLREDTVWLNRQQIADLFHRDIKTIGKHIQNAKAEELKGIPTVAKFAIVQKEGNRLINRMKEFYNLDMILSVGYRVKSPQGIMFRRWANSILKEYLLHGHAINQRIERLEQRVSKTEKQKRNCSHSAGWGFLRTRCCREATEAVSVACLRHAVPRTVTLPHTEAVALCGVIRMASLRHVRDQIQASDYEHRFIGA